VVLTHSLPLARPNGLPIYVARLPPAPFALRCELDTLVAAGLGIFEDYAFVIDQNQLTGAAEATRI
jgi:hypothetical protein